MSAEHAVDKFLAEAKQDLDKVLALKRHDSWNGSQAEIPDHLNAYLLERAGNGKDQAMLAECEKLLTLLERRTAILQDLN